MMGFVTGVAAVSSARRAPSAVCTRSSFAGAAVAAAPVARATVRMSNIQESIQTEIAKAKEASEKFGKTSKEAAAAWYVLLECPPGSLLASALCGLCFFCDSPGVGVCVFFFGLHFHRRPRLLTSVFFSFCTRVDDRCLLVGCHVVDCADFWFGCCYDTGTRWRSLRRRLRTRRTLRRRTPWRSTARTCRRRMSAAPTRIRS